MSRGDKIHRLEHKDGFERGEGYFDLKKLGLIENLMQTE